MGQVQSMDKAVSVFVGDGNYHHMEWLESASHTDGHGRDALDFSVNRWFVVPLIFLVIDLTWL